MGVLQRFRNEVIFGAEFSNANRCPCLYSKDKLYLPGIENKPCSLTPVPEILLCNDQKRSGLVASCKVIDECCSYVGCSLCKKEFRSKSRKRYCVRSIQCTFKKKRKTKVEK